MKPTIKTPINTLINILPYHKRIEELKEKLSATDYKAIKYAEGLISEEEYAPIKAERIAWREQIGANEELIRVINEANKKG